MFKARDANDADAASTYFHPDCVFQIMGSEALHPFTRQILGKAALKDVMRALVENWDFSGVRSIQTLVDGNTVVVRRKGGVRHIPTNTILDTEWVDIFSVKNGLIHEFSEFVDTHLVAETIRSR